MYSDGRSQAVANRPEAVVVILGYSAKAVAGCQKPQAIFDSSAAIDLAPADWGRTMNVFVTPIATLLEQGAGELQGAIQGDQPELQLYEKIDWFLLGKVFNDDRFRGLDSTILQLAAHSRNVWTAGVRMALSGQPYAVPPIVRTALEAACYASLINHDVSLARIWLDRHNNPQSMKASRKAFGSAVETVRKLLNSKASGLGDQVNEAYQGCIDDGAHPNTWGIPRTRKLVLGPNNFREEYDETTDFYGIPSIKSKDALCLVAYIGLLMCHILCLTFMPFHELPHGLLDEMLDEFNGIIPQADASPVDFSSIIRHD